MISFIKSVYIYKKEGKKRYCEVISKTIHPNHFKSGSGVDQFWLLSKNDSSEMTFRQTNFHDRIQVCTNTNYDVL